MKIRPVGAERTNVTKPTVAFHKSVNVYKKWTSPNCTTDIFPVDSKAIY